MNILNIVIKEKKKLQEQLDKILPKTQQLQKEIHTLDEVIKLFNPTTFLRKEETQVIPPTIIPTLADMFRKFASNKVEKGFTLELFRAYIKLGYAEHYEVLNKNTNNVANYLVKNGELIKEGEGVNTIYKLKL
jgi:hypothetical protein